MVITFGLIDYPGLQIQLFIISSVLYMCYLSSLKIYEDNFMFRLEYINESIFLLTSYHFILFTSILDKEDPYTPELIGKSMIIIIVLLLAITAIINVLLSCKVLCIKLKAKLDSKQQQKVIDKKEVEV